jgi:hypothetical protein
MAKKYVFKAPAGTPPDHIINNVYGFKDGEHVRNETDGPLVAKILVDYHGCTLDVIDDNPTESDDKPAEASLAKDVTAGAKDPE